MKATANPLLHFLRGLPAALRAVTDAELVARFTAAGHDGEAFAELVRRHGPTVLGVCRRLLADERDAEDAFQASFVALTHHAQRLRRPEAVAAWLHGTARRLALKCRRTAERRRRHEAKANVPPTVGPLDELSAREFLAVLDDEIARLRESYRLPLILCCLQGRTQEEAAQQLGWSPDSVRGRLERGRRCLEARLRKRGLGLSAALVAGLLGSTATALPRRLAECAVALGTHKEADSAVVLELARMAGAGRTVDLSRWVMTIFVTGLLGSGALLLARSGQKSPAVAPAASRVTNPVPVEADADPLPAGALRRLGSTRLRHADAVNAVAYTPAGDFLVSAGRDNRARLWNATTGREVRSFALKPDGGATAAVHAVIVSPDGGRVAAAGWGAAAVVWDISTGKELWRRQGVGWAIAFTPDGLSLLVAEGEAVICLDALSGEPMRRTDGANNDRVRCLALSPDGKLLATGGKEASLVLWDVATLRQVRSLSGHAGEVRALAFSPDGKLLASGGTDKTFRVWDVPTGRELYRRETDTHYVNAVAFAPDGQALATGGADRVVRRWDVKTGRELARYEGHTHEILSLTFAPDGRTLAGGSYGQTIHLWNVETHAERIPHTGHLGGMNAVAYEPHGRFVATAGWDRTVRLWDGAGVERLRLAGPTRGLRSIAFAPDGRTLAAVGDDAFAWLWSVPDGRELGRLPLGTANDANQATFGVAFAPDGATVAVAHGNGSVSLWEPATGKRRLVLAAHQGGPAYAVAYSPDGKQLASGGLDQRVRLWNARSGTPVRMFEGHPGWVLSVGFAPNGRLLAGTGVGQSRGDIVSLWNPETGVLIDQLSHAGDRLHVLALSPDGQLLATAGRGGPIRLREIATRRQRRTFIGQEYLVSALAFSPDGRTLVSGGADGTAIVWDVSLAAEKPAPGAAKPE